MGGREGEEARASCEGGGGEESGGGSWGKLRVEGEGGRGGS